MRKILFVSFLTILSICSFGQAQYTITGTVIDSAAGAGIALATAYIKADSTDKIIQAVNADVDGKFSIEKVEPGKYQLSVTSLGFATLTKNLEVTGNLALGKMLLSASSKTLGEATITAAKAEIVRTAEKTVFNVSQSPTAQIGTAEDALRNVPGVMVDQKGNVSIIGKQGVKVLVDGKPNAFAQNNLPAFLKSVPANSIDAIEVITNPSAKYDAEGNAGIINIKLKKGKADGLNGNISAGYGFFNRYNANLSINYRKNKFNFFADYSYHQHKIDNRWIEQRTITAANITSYYNMDSKGQQQGLNNSLKTGFDYFVNDKNSFNYTAGASYSKDKWSSNAASQSFDANRNLQASYNSIDDEPFRSLNISNDLSYSHTFDSSEHKLDIDVIHTYLNTQDNATLNSLAYDSAGIYSPMASLLRKWHTGVQVNNLIVQADYTYPFKKLPGHKIEAGLKNEATLNKSQYDAYTVLNNIEQRDSLLSNSSNYFENIAAAYFIYSGGYKKLFQWSAGLRAEHTYIHSNISAVSKNYVSFFPNASLNYNITETQSLSANYSRRVQRPEFRQINNIVSYVDQYSTWQGNPYIQPSFSHIISLNYSLMVRQHMFSLQALGNLQTDGFIESTRQDTVNHITRGGVLNGADSKSFNLIFYFKLQLTKWWELQMNHTYDYSYYSFKQGINGAPLAGSHYNLWGSTSFKFWKNTTLEINGWFNTRGPQPQGISFPSGTLNASIKKSFLKDDRLSVSIAAHDILQSMKFRWTIDNANLQTLGSWQMFNRTVMVTLSYRFGQNQTQHREKEGNSRLGGNGGGR